MDWRKPIKMTNLKYKNEPLEIIYVLEFEFSFYCETREVSSSIILKRGVPQEPSNMDFILRRD